MKQITEKNLCSNCKFAHLILDEIGEIAFVDCTKGLKDVNISGGLTTCIRWEAK